ncbi:hypothetical protein PR202_gb00075 [Eleusine coracana subsp. coracana]|uniref:Uncharacterized protein n=1 Tax=Eleusine coracana subsp. coracana TaxID=191504 RepID=A0AAV5DSQ3_ELECO|nr:hypothetical protein PR202_gb00075 [Eleusine coracana subsp. coracana]
MAGLRRRSLLPVAALLLLAVLAACAAADDPEGNIRIQVRYPTEEESQRLDRWAAKYQSTSAESGSDGFSITPATKEESAYLNRMVANANKRAAEGSRDGRAAGYDAHLEFDDDDPGSLWTPCTLLTEMDDDMGKGNQDERAHAEGNWWFINLFQ